MNPYELQMHRRQITALIEANPLPVVLQRRVRVATPGGGYDDHATEDLDEQLFILVETAGRGTLEGTISRGEGELMKADFILIGRHDADIKDSDGYFRNDEHFEVYYVSPYRQIRTAAGIRVWEGEETHEEGTYDA